MSALINVIDPAGNVVTVKAHSLKKGPGGVPVLKPGWKLAPTPTKK